MFEYFFILIFFVVSSVVVLLCKLFGLKHIHLHANTFLQALIHMRTSKMNYFRIRLPTLGQALLLASAKYIFLHLHAFLQCFSKNSL